MDRKPSKIGQNIFVFRSRKGFFLLKKKNHNWRGSYYVVFDNVIYKTWSIGLKQNSLKESVKVLWMVPIIELCIKNHTYILKIMNA